MMLEEAIRMMNEGRSTNEVAKLFNVSEPTMRRVKAAWRVKKKSEFSPVWNTDQLTHFE